MGRLSGKVAIITGGARRIGDTAMLDDRDQTAQIAYIRKKLRFRQEKL